MTTTSSLDDLFANRSSQPDAVSPADVAPGAKKTYSRPELFAHGNLRSLTFGGSPGTAESGDLSGTHNYQ